MNNSSQAVLKAVKKAGGQEKLAKILGVSQSAVSHWANGARKVSPALFAKFEAIGIKRKDLRPDLFGRAA